MTVASSTNRVDYTGNGSTTVFSFTFRIFADTDIVVITADDDGVETTLELNTDYTVTGVGSYSGGTVVMGTAPTNGQALTIQRVLPLTQQTDLRNQGQFFAETHEDVFDRMAMINQQLQEQIDRAAKLPVTRQEDADSLVADIVLLADNNDNINTIASNISDVQTVADDLNEDVSEINTVATNIANVNIVGGISSNVTTVAGVAANVTTVAGVAANVTTVAGIAPAVSGVAAISSAVSAVNSNASNINTVAGINANVTTVAGVSANVTTVAGIAAAVSTVAADGTDIGVVAGISADVQAVADIAADVAAVENIAANVTTVAGIAANVTTVAGVAADVTTVAGIASDVAAVENIAANVTTVAGISSAVSTVATNNANVSTVATNIAAVNTVATDIAAIITAANDLNEAVSEIEVVANNIAAVDTVGDNIASVNAVAAIDDDVSVAAANVADITNFADVYQGASATAPTQRADASALQVGDLYFNTTDDQMKVYGGSGWQSVGSTVNGTSQRYRYIATASQTTFTGSDSNSNTLGYDVGFIDVYLNGVRLDQTDYTATSGDSVVLTSGAAANDEINIVAYGNFELADHYNKTDADSRFLNVTGDESMTGELFINGKWIRGSQTGGDSLTLIGGASGTGNKLQIRGSAHPTAPNVATLDLNGSEILRYTATARTEFGLPAFNCRAWVNFNGTGTVAIRGSGNVSSITDNGTGNYSVNFTTSLPDDNSCVVITADHDNGSYAALGFVDRDNTPLTTARARINILRDGFSPADAAHINVSIFR